MAARLAENEPGLGGLSLVLGILLVVGRGLHEQGGIDCDSGRPAGWTPQAPEGRSSQTVLEECQERELR